MTCLAATAFADNNRPNILFIMSDDHATQAIGAYGGRLAKLNPTPNIDALARQGMRFDRVFCNNSICTPSRARTWFAKRSKMECRAPQPLKNMESSKSSCLPFRLDHEVAIITGGATGIGFGVAQSFVAAGATVVLVGRREDELKKAVGTLGATAHYVRHDVTEHAKADELVSAATRAAGAPPSILINCAGIHLKKPAVETSPEEFLAVLNTHVIGAHALDNQGASRRVARTGRPASQGRAGGGFHDTPRAARGSENTAARGRLAGALRAP